VREFGGGVLLGWWWWWCVCVCVCGGGGLCYGGEGILVWWCGGVLWDGEGAGRVQAAVRLCVQLGAACAGGQLRQQDPQAAHQQAQQQEPTVGRRRAATGYTLGCIFWCLGWSSTPGGNSSSKEQQ
jgi:hypothetical protein